MVVMLVMDIRLCATGDGDRDTNIGDVGDVEIEMLLG